MLSGSTITNTVTWGKTLSINLIYFNFTFDYFINFYFLELGWDT